MADEATPFKPKKAVETPEEAGPDAGPASPESTLTPERLQKASEAFARFQELQINPKAMATARLIVTNCPVRRPRNNEFVRVNDAVEPFVGLVYEDREEEVHYLVQPAALQFFYSPPPPKLLALTINQNGAFFLWPVPATEDNNGWNISARKAFHMAKTDWVKLVGDRGAGFYNVYIAEGELPPPRWPDKSYWELLDLAFPNSKVVSGPDHGVIHKVRTGQARKQ